MFDLTSIVFSDVAVLEDRLMSPLTHIRHPKPNPNYLCLFDPRPETRRDVYATFLDYSLVMDGETYNMLAESP